MVAQTEKRVPNSGGKGGGGQITVILQTTDSASVWAREREPFRVYFELSHNFCCVFVVDSQNNPFET